MCRSPRGCTSSVADEEFRHQRTDAAGVVQMHMGRDHPVHGVARHAERFQRAEQPRQRQPRARVDEGRASTVTIRKAASKWSRWKAVSMAKTPTQLGSR